MYLGSSLGYYAKVVGLHNGPLELAIAQPIDGPLMIKSASLVNVDAGLNFGGFNQLFYSVGLDDLFSGCKESLNEVIKVVSGKKHLFNELSVLRRINDFLNSAFLDLEVFDLGVEPAVLLPGDFLVSNQLRVGDYVTMRCYPFMIA